MNLIHSFKCPQLLYKPGRIILLLTATMMSLDAAPPAQSGPAPELELQELLEATVVSAALHEQSVRQAPAAVTIISAEDIRRYGYRTLGEALASTPGFFETDDRTYQSVGIRGMAIPGDWQTRMLVLLDGHALTDNVYGTNGGLGREFPVDLKLVKRIEIIRGPGSALYGNSGIFATVNVITFAPEDLPGTSVRIDSGSFAARGLSLTTSTRWRGARALVSASGWQNHGEQSISIPGMPDEGVQSRVATDVDGETATRFFTRILAGRWSLWAAASDRRKIQPISWIETAANDTGTRAIDMRGMVAAEYTREFNQTRKLIWRTTWDKFAANYDARYLQDGTVVHNREFDRGDWLTSQGIYSFAAGRLHTLTAGADVRLDLRTSVRNADLAPVYIPYTSMSMLDRVAGVFGQDEFRLSRSLTLVGAARLDYSALHGRILSPKASVIWDALPGTTAKAIVSRGMRYPTAYESYYTDTLTTANPFLRQERINNLETVVQHRVAPGVEAILDVYTYSLQDVIASTTMEDGMFRYENLGRIRAKGVELSMHAHVGQSGAEVNVSATWQQARNRERIQMPNSPGFLGKVRLSSPLGRTGLRIAGLLDYVSERRSNERNILDPVLLPGLTLSSRRYRGGLRFEAGARNLTNVRYFDPVSFMRGVDMIPRPGRNIFLALTWQQAGE